MTLQLQFACTEAERKEATSLSLHQQCGGGPKWRVRLILFGVLAFALGLVYLQFRLMSPKERPWFYAIGAGAFIFFFFIKNKSRKKEPVLARLEVSEQGILFDGGEKDRTTIPWSGFSKCLESPNLFAMVNRTSNLLFVLPKRAFPDEAAQNWFRSLATQPANVTVSSAPERIAPGRFAGKGVTITLQLGYRDYVTRMFTSWRTRGIAVAILLFILVIFIVQEIHPSPHAVVPGWKVFLIMMGILIPMMTAMFFFVAFYSWLTERKFLVQQHVALSGDGLEFASSDAVGLTPWSTYKYYLENRWAFFIWQPRGAQWFMFPKRDFASPSDLEQCRELFQKNLKASRWFYF